MNYLKKATKTPETDETQTREIVVNMLDDIKENGEEAIKKYAEKLDNWTGDFIITQDDIDKAAASLDQRTKEDIQFAHEQVYNFAKSNGRACLNLKRNCIPGLWPDKN
jgi:sulfopropanediol 3-dehydrogenase